MDWDKVVRDGSKVWAEWKKTSNSSQNFQWVTEVLAIKCMERIKNRLNIIDELNGSTDKKWIDMAKRENIGASDVYTTFDGLIDKLMNGATRKRALILTIRDISTTLMYDHKDKNSVWLFDSHGGLEPGHSTLVECKKPSAIVGYLKRKYPIDSSPAHLWSHAQVTDQHNMFFATIIEGRPEN